MDKKTGGFSAPATGSTVFGQAPPSGFGFKPPVAAANPAAPAIGFGFGGPKPADSAAQPAKPQGFGFAQPASNPAAGLAGLSAPKFGADVPAAEKPAAAEPAKQFGFGGSIGTKEASKASFSFTMAKKEEPTSFKPVEPESKTPEAKVASTVVAAAPKPVTAAAVTAAPAVEQKSTFNFGAPAAKPAAVAKPFSFGPDSAPKEEIKKLETPAPAPAPAAVTAPAAAQVPAPVTPAAPVPAAAPAAPAKPVAAAKPIEMTEEEQQKLEQKFKLKRVVDLSKFEVQNQDKLLEEVELTIKKACADFMQNVTDQIVQQTKQIAIQIPPQAMATAPVQQDSQLTRQLAQMEAQITNCVNLVNNLQVNQLQSSQLQSSQILQNWSPEHKMIIAGCGAVFVLLLLIICIKK